METPAHIAEAERLGYQRAWVYDSPALYPDVWITLAMAAERTATIGLGPAVLIPSLRHPMTNAAAIATLAALAPGRLSVAVGAGFTGRYALGQKPLRWSDVEAYVGVVRQLLRGDTAEWEGAPIRMLHPAGFGARRPIEVPLLIGADGPKGAAVAQRVGDGVFAAGIPNSAVAAGRQVLLQFGTVIAEGDDVRSQRVLDAAGPAIAVLFHALYERGGAAAVSRLPGGDEWVAGLEALPERDRHLVTHDGHLVSITKLDEKAVVLAADLLPAMTFSGTPEQLRAKVATFEAAGVTEIAYQPAGPDLVGELERMKAALSDG